MTFFYGLRQKIGKHLGFLSSPSDCRTSGASKDRDSWCFCRSIFWPINFWSLRALGSDFLRSCFSFIIRILPKWYTKLLNICQSHKYAGKICMHIDYIVNFVHFFKRVPRAPSDEPNGQKYSPAYYGILKLRNSIKCLHCKFVYTVFNCVHFPL